MPVVGIDLGSDSVVLSLAFRGGVDIVLNDFSKRSTPCIVGFTERERIFGDAALLALGFNADNTIPAIKRVIGLKYSQVLPEDLAMFPCKVIADQNDNIIFEVKYLNKVRQFTPVQVLAMIFTKMKLLAEAKAGVKGVEAVVGVPVYFTDRQRRDVIRALEIAGIRCECLLNDVTAAGIEYAIYRTFTDEQPQTVAFVDVGHCDSTCTIATFTKTKMKVIASTFLRDFGGITFDRVIFNQLVQDIKQKYGLDVMSNKKAKLRLMRESEKLKKTLSGFPIATQRIECFMNDIDVVLEVNREQVEKQMESHFARLEGMIKQCIVDSKLKPEEINSVELIGGCAYIPTIKKIVAHASGQAVMTTLNATECISRGLAFQGAILTPYYVLARELTVTDAVLFPINSGYKASGNAQHMEVEGEDEQIKQSPIFKVGEATPNSKILTFTRSHNFDVYLMYGQSPYLAENADNHVGKFTISKVPNKPSKIKVRIRHNASGIATVEDAQLFEDVEVLEEIKPEPTKHAEPAKPSAEAPKDGEQKPAEQPAAEPEKPAEPQFKKVMKTVKHDLPVSSSVPHDVTQDQITKLIREEFEMVNNDLLVAATAEAKNSLESSIYSYRDKVDYDYKDFLTDKAREDFHNAINAAEEWLLSEGEDSTKDEYVNRLHKLSELAKPAERRRVEASTRPAATQVLLEAIDSFKKFVASTDEKYAHIEQADRQKVQDAVDKATAWVNEQLAAQSKLATNQDPVLTVESLRNKDKELRNICNPIVNKPKPTPKKEEPKKEEPKKEEPAKPADADAKMQE